MNCPNEAYIAILEGNVRRQGHILDRQARDLARTVADNEALMDGMMSLRAAVAQLKLLATAPCRRCEAADMAADRAAFLARVDNFNPHRPLFPNINSDWYLDDDDDSAMDLDGEAFRSGHRSAVATTRSVDGQRDDGFFTCEDVSSCEDCWSPHSCDGMVKFPEVDALGGSPADTSLGSLASMSLLESSAVSEPCVMDDAIDGISVILMEGCDDVFVAASAPVEGQEIDVLADTSGPASLPDVPPAPRRRASCHPTVGSSVRRRTRARRAEHPARCPTLRAGPGLLMGCLMWCAIELELRSAEKGVARMPAVKAPPLAVALAHQRRTAVLGKHGKNG